MNDIMRALARGEDPDTVVNREALKYAVMRRIMCPLTGHVLDVRTAVLYTVTAPDGKTGCEVVDGPAWDAMAATIGAACAAKGITLDVIDGRALGAS